MDLALHLINTRYAQQAILCNSLLDVANAMAEKPDTPNLRDVGLLAQLSLALQKVVTRDDKVSLLAALEIAEEVRASV